MSHHRDDAPDTQPDIPARDQVADPITPSQAEGERDLVEAQLRGDMDADVTETEQPDAHRTPGKAEGTEGTVESQL